MYEDEKLRGKQKSLVNNMRMTPVGHNSYESRHSQEGKGSLGMK